MSYSIREDLQKIEIGTAISIIVEGIHPDEKPLRGDDAPISRAIKLDYDHPLTVRQVGVLIGYAMAVMADFVAEQNPDADREKVIDEVYGKFALAVESGKLLVKSGDMQRYENKEGVADESSNDNQ